MTEKTTVDITPDKSLIQKLGLTGYRTAEAISELLDNSIDARISGQTERIDVVLDYSRKAISISDDGIGMNLDELRKGLTIAKGTKLEKEKLGKFGLGMKSACSTLGREFTIRTSKPDSDLEYFIRYDEDEWLKNSSQTWQNFEIETSKKSRPWNGTTIKITKLNVPLYPNQTTTLRKNFGIRYGSYIKSNQISLFINTRECKSLETPIQPGSKKILDLELTNNNYLKGWIGLLEKRSIKGEYGVHLYKNNRLIKAFDKFGIRSHPEIAKFTGKLHLDHVPVNFHKTGFIEESLEYQEAVQAFKTDPEVIEVLRSSISKPPSTTSIQSVLNYFVNDETKGKIKPKMSNANSKILLNKAESFDVDYDSHKLVVKFENGTDDELYHLNKIPSGHKITINRKSPIFSIIGNPLFLIGLIELEVKTLIDQSVNYREFLEKRNAAWTKFVNDWSETQEKTRKRKPPHIIPLPNYSISNELGELHEFLKEKFEFNFQFTALSTLRPFLQNAYNKMIYNIDVTKNSGQQLHDMILDFNNKEFVVLLNPKSEEINKALQYSEKSKFIVIREYTTVSKETWASPPKAWIDLLLELKKGPYGIRGDEMANILDYLLDNNLTNQTRLETVGRHKNVLSEIYRYLGDVG
ncbi:MAG: ATP-binding protein [Nitrosopumilaceae archaeon]|nr:ATP-binding protein [Nitrosopumilaceae archaeon]